jgi:type IV secretion system protein VirB10
VRFDTLILPNGVTRDFRSRMGSVDGQSTSQLDRGEGKLKGEGNKGGDARTVGEAAAGGVTVGAIAGSAAGRAAMGAGIGAAAGAAAGLVGVLATRGPDAMLAKGTTLEMVLDRPVEFTAAETEFEGTGTARRAAAGGEAAAPARRSLPVPGMGIPGRRLP